MEFHRSTPWLSRENRLPGASEALREAPAAAAGQLHSGAAPPGLHGTEGVQAPPGGDGGDGAIYPRAMANFRRNMRIKL